MSQHIIIGEKKLEGSIRISGAKNSTLPILSAAILASQPVIFDNVPLLNDVTTILQLLARMGAKVVVHDDMRVEIDPSTISSYDAPSDLVTAMRASILVLGPLLAKYGKATVALPGGCKIGSRPVDLHMEGMKALGAKVTIEDNAIVATTEDGLTGANFRFSTITVTGSENVIMAAVLASGTTVLENVACEPEVSDLCLFLNKLGAKISGIGTDILIIEGVKELEGGEYSIIADRIETGTYLVAAAMTQGSLTCLNAKPDTLFNVIDKLKEAGADIECGEDWIKLEMKGRPKAVDINTEPYPGFPTDLQAQFMALNTIAIGNSVITENIFENRFQQVDELVKMGANIIVKGNKAYCTGVKDLKGAIVSATDLRASACLVLAALVATGKTVINCIHHTDRGYELIEEKLAGIGASIHRIDTTENILENA